MTNWTNWFGYHFINKLLQENYQVDGLIFNTEDKFNHFSAFFARNSLFTFVEEKDLSNYTEIIRLGDSKLNLNPSRRSWHINCNLSCNNRECIFVSTPILFGEWMPLSKRGIYHNGQEILFTSHKFMSESLYIDDFLNIFLQWLNSTLTPQSIYLKSRDQIKGNIIKSLENVVCFRDNRPKHNYINQLREHYKDHKQFYFKQVDDFHV